MVRAVTSDDTGLKVVYEPTAISAQTIDIIAIHGIGAHPDDTWSKNVSTDEFNPQYVNWLSDPKMLPSVTPNARILRYGYESQWFGDHVIRQNVSTVADRLLRSLKRERKGSFQSRPIVFIAHCFGGLVVIKALLRAGRDQQEWPGIYGSVSGMIFLGTPFRGAPGLTQAEMIHAAQAFYRDTEGEVLRILDPGDEMLLEMVHDFGKLRDRSLTKAQIACFYEQKPCNVKAVVGKEEKKSFAVSESSGCLDTAQKIGLQRTHFDVNKFGRPTDEEYLTVCDIIMDMMEAAPRIVEPQIQPLRSSHAPISSMPFEMDKQFIGREDILSQIEEQFRISYRVSLYGLGGIGKSQIVIEYAYRYQIAHPQGRVFWVYAANGSRFDQSYRDIARKLKLPRADDPDIDVCKLVSDWLNDDESEEWLIILDNADNPDLFFGWTRLDAATQASTTNKPLADYLPRKVNSKRSLLITTRNRQLAEDLSNGERCIEVLPFSLCEATVLLRCKAGSISNIWDDSDTDKLAEVLGRIPLALTQAAAFIKRNQMPLARYRESLEEHEQNIKDYLGTEHRDYRRERGIPNAVFRTWELSYNQIREQEPQASAILSLMAMFDRQQIPELLFRQQERDAEFFAAIGSLNNLSLITKEIGKETYAMHRLVQLSVHVWLEQHNEKTRYEEKSLALLANRFPEGEYGDKGLRESLLPHAQAVLRYDLISQSSLLQRAKLLYNIGWFDLLQGKFERGHQRSLKSYEIYRTQCGSGDPGTLKSSILVALMLRYQGEYRESEKLSRRALEEFEKILGMEHPDVLAGVNTLAIVLQDQGKYEEGERMDRRALEGREKALGKEHPDTLASVNNLALVLQDQGKYVEAEQMNRRALEGGEKALGTEHPDTLTSVNNLASVLQDQGKYVEAEQMNRRALKRREKALGTEHPDTLTSVSSLALVLQYQGKYVEAEQMNRQALKGYEKALGIEHPNTLTSVSNLALVLRDQGKYVVAEQMNQRALEGREKALGTEHPDTLTSVNNLASVLRDQGKYVEAEQMNRRALKRREKALGTEHPDTLTSVSSLALVLQYQRKYVEAEQMNRRVLKEREKALGTEHPDTLTSVNNLALVLQDQGKYVEAEQMNRRALEGSEKALGTEHPDTLTSVNNLASVLRDQGKYVKAEQMNRRALEGREKALGTEHPDTLTSVNNLALVLQYQKKYVEAEQMNQRALEGSEKALGTEHLDTLTSVYNLACLYHQQRRYDIASELYQRARDAYKRVLGPQHPDTVACCTHYSRMISEMDQSTQ